MGAGMPGESRKPRCPEHLTVCLTFATFFHFGVYICLFVCFFGWTLCWMLINYFKSKHVGAAYAPGVVLILGMLALSCGRMNSFRFVSLKFNGSLGIRRQNSITEWIVANECRPKTISHRLPCKMANFKKLLKNTRKFLRQSSHTPK